VKQETIYYPNGNVVKIIPNKGQYIKYATGDEVWMEMLPSEKCKTEPKMHVIKVQTHDGISWEQGGKLKFSNKGLRRHLTTDVIAFVVLILILGWTFISNYFYWNWNILK
jgi:hypothetical protein